jgi:hypothetical protein
MPTTEHQIVSTLQQSGSKVQNEIITLMEAPEEEGHGLSFMRVLPNQAALSFKALSTIT